MYDSIAPAGVGRPLDRPRLSRAKQLATCLRLRMLRVQDMSMGAIAPAAISPTASRHDAALEFAAPGGCT